MDQGSGSPIKWRIINRTVDLLDFSFNELYGLFSPAPPARLNLLTGEELNRGALTMLQNGHYRDEGYIRMHRRASLPFEKVQFPVQQHPRSPLNFISVAYAKHF